MPADHYTIYAGTTAHKRETWDEALWLARSLSRHGRTSIDRVWYADDPDEGPDTVFTQEVWTSETDADNAI